MADVRDSQACRGGGLPFLSLPPNHWGLCSRQAACSSPRPPLPCSLWLVEGEAVPEAPERGTLALPACPLGIFVLTAAHRVS